MSHIKIIKRKARGFFKKEDIVTIKDTVVSVHKIITDASILLRAFYLRWFQSSYPLDNGQDALELEHYHVSMACNIVQGVTSPPVRGTGPEQNAKIAVYEEMMDEYNKLYGRLSIKSDIATNLSLSHILTYSIENLLTAYTNNIQSHFPKYTKRYIRCDMLSKGADKTEAKKIAAFFTNAYLYDSSFDIEPGFLESYGLDLASYSFLFPPNISKKSRAWDLKVHPWVYLPKMVWINQTLETDFSNIAAKERKLYNPLPFHSSFVPLHIRLDTSGLSQLLMTKTKIEDFKKLYLTQHNVSPNMKSKGDMLRSFEKLFGRQATSNKESGLYATELWSFLTNLKTCRHWKELQGVIRKNDPKKTCWVFDNSIVTDGVSVSFQVIDDKMFGRKAFSERNKVDDNSKDHESVTCDEVKNCKVLGCDPGKKDIVAITDGFKTICYTKGQRDTDTHKKTRLNDCLKRRRTQGLEEYETQVMNRYQKRSCHPETFRRYACSRKRIEPKITNCYQHPMFREFKFLVYSKTKSSEDRFKHKIFETFKDSQTEVDYGKCSSDVMKANASKEVSKCQDFLIGWGDWGKKPNALKCGGPTPGIGIRRRFESLFKTTTVPEHYSSQECPCCKGRCLKKARIGGEISNPITKHHLLRCTNENCQSRWWNRNVAGAFNILSRLLDGKTLSGNETTGSGLRRRRPLKPRT